MESANVQLVRSIYAASRRGDYSSAEWAHPEIELEIIDGPSPGRWMGVAGMAEGFSTVLDAWENFRVDADEYRELDGERVLVLDHYAGRGRTSGLELAQMGPQGASLFHMQDGKVARLVIYWERERGLADLGLSPQRGTRSSYNAEAERP